MGECITLLRSAFDEEVVYVPGFWGENEGFCVKETITDDHDGVYTTS